MKIVYSFNKKGYEAGYWEREIAAGSTKEIQFIPFNHDPYLSPDLYIRAQLLDNLYYGKHPDLQRMYKAFEEVISNHHADAVLVDTCPPYHPDYLRRIKAYKVLRIADGPISAYDRDFAYLHAYNHVLYHSPAYSPEMGMAEKLSYCGAKKFDFWPLALFDQMFDPMQTEETILSHERDIDVLFIGSLHLGKMPLIAQVKKAFGKCCRIHGVASLKKNLYFNFRFGFPGWLSPIGFEEYVPLYQRTKIGINIHNRGQYTAGNYRLFDLPGNGVMQISDGGSYLESFFKVGKEIIDYQDADDLIDLIRFFIREDEERKRIALNGFTRVRKDHRIGQRLREAGVIIAAGMKR